MYFRFESINSLIKILLFINFELNWNYRIHLFLYNFDVCPVCANAVQIIYCFYSIFQIYLGLYFETKIMTIHY